VLVVTFADSSYFTSIAPVRFTLFFLLTSYTFLFSAKSPLASSANGTYVPSRWGEGLKNRVLFTWAFVELITWFWIYAALQEERREAALRARQRREAEENRL
jgi:Increased loss of mitochondrial DNA protein 1